MDQSNLYDEMTGVESDASLEARQDEVVQKAIDDSQKLVEFSKHPGWILMRNVMLETIEKEQHNLLFATHMDYVTKLQASIRARRELLGWLEMKILEGQTLISNNQAQTP